MRVVVLGGTGNISESIVRLLLERGHDVTCFNRGIRGGLPAEVRHMKGTERIGRPLRKPCSRKNSMQSSI